MEVGDVVLLKTDNDSDLRWVAVVSNVDGHFAEYVALVTTIREGKRVAYSVDCAGAGMVYDMIRIGHVDQSIREEVQQ